MTTATSEGTYYVPEMSKLPLLASAGLFLSVFGASTWLSGMPTNPLFVALALFIVAASVFDWGRRLTIVAGIIVFILVNAASEKIASVLTGPMILAMGVAVFITVLWSWFATVIRENIAGLNSPQVKRSYVWGMSWFIFSETMLFSVFFGALFYVRTLAVPWLSGEGHGASNVLLWPGFEATWPLMVTPDMAAHGDSANVLGPGESMSFSEAPSLWTWLPFWNTVLLVASSVTCHLAHSAIKRDARKAFNTWLGITIVLAVTFLTLQAEEYVVAYQDMGLTLQSGIYGATFFMLTGFHGVHVLLGTIMLSVMWLRSVLKGHFSSKDSFGFDAASWYWHFVDVVWVGLFFAVYIFG